MDELTILTQGARFMNCPNCGYQNPDNVGTCLQCNTSLRAAQQPYQVQQAVPDYMVWSILATLFCCLPAGIVAIVKAASANTKKKAGDFSGAMEDANNAKTWLMVSVVLGVVGGLIYGIITFFSVVNSGAF